MTRFLRGTHIFLVTALIVGCSVQAHAQPRISQAAISRLQSYIDSCNSSVMAQIEEYEDRTPENQRGYTLTTPDQVEHTVTRQQWIDESVLDCTRTAAEADPLLRPLLTDPLPVQTVAS